MEITRVRSCWQNSSRATSGRTPAPSREQGRGRLQSLFEKHAAGGLRKKISSATRSTARHAAHEFKPNHGRLRALLANSRPSSGHKAQDPRHLDSTRKPISRPVTDFKSRLYPVPTRHPHPRPVEVEPPTAMVARRPTAHCGSSDMGTPAAARPDGRRGQQRG